MRKHARSPLNYQSEKFNRSYKISPAFKIPEKVLRSVLKILFVYLLLMIDLVLFTGSGNLDIFMKNAFICPELGLLAVFLSVFSAVLIGAFYFSEKIQTIICSIVTFAFVIALFNQFSQFDQETFVGYYLRDIFGDFVPKMFFSYSHIFVAFVMAFGVFWFISKSSVKSLSVFTTMFLLTLAGILRQDYLNSRNQHDFVEIYQTDTIPENISQNQKFVYIMLPNLASYKYFGLYDDKDNQEALQIVSGFLAKNKFEVYPNAYNSSGDTFLNMVEAVNPFDEKVENNHIMDTLMLYKYWNFFNLHDDYILLKDNQMFDTFKNADYKISAYKSRGLDICRKKYGFNVDRCIEKLNRPVNLYSMNLPLFARTKLLFIEWLTSMKILKNLSIIYKALKIFTRPEELPMIGINYNNLYVVNSIKTFDVLAENLKKDKGRQAYFVYADIPSDMYIYDEFCRIKPQSEWISLRNLPWVNINNSRIKQKAYIEQTKCLYGKLQEFIDNLNTDGLINNTVLVLNGMSGTNNFQNNNIEDVNDDILYNRLVMLAIKSPKNKAFDVRDEACSPHSILKNYLYGLPKCTSFAESGLHIRWQKSLSDKLTELNISNLHAESNAAYFDNWYQQWLLHNDNMNAADIVSNERKQKNAEISERHLPELMNNSLNNSIEEAF